MKPPIPHNSGYTLPRHLYAVSAGVFALTAVFWLTPLDLYLAALFYDPQQPFNPWYGEEFWLWQLLYRGVPLLANGLVILALALLAGAAYAPRPDRVRRAFAAKLLLLTLVIGPGLLVNGLFKENWGRPRPRQVVELGGDAVYLPPLRLSIAGEGKSFPCGHCSVGFSLLALAYYAQVYSRGWTALLGLVALSFGVLLGIGRMAAGAHFASDILWSAYLSWLAAALAYASLVRFTPRLALSPAWQRGLYGLGGLLVCLGALLATPFQQTIQHISHASGRALLRLEAETGDITVRVSAQAALNLQVNARGFAAPLSRMRLDATPDGYKLVSRGWFTELDSQWLILLPPEFAASVALSARRGNIRIQIDPGLTAPPMATHAPQGQVQR